ncbi:MAG: heavy metal-responsive transcriptional regulator [bacterium]
MALLTIGRLGRRAGIEPKTLRYYDRVGLVRPSRRTPTGYRVYDDDALERLDFVRRAKALGMSLADIRRLLAFRDDGAAPCTHVQELVARNLEEVESQVARLASLRKDLRRVQAQLQRRLLKKAESGADCPCFEIIASFRKGKP